VLLQHLHQVRSERGFPGEGLASDKRARVAWREGARSCGVCYATSKDGIHWGEKPLAESRAWANQCFVTIDF